MFQGLEEIIKQLLILEDEYDVSAEELCDLIKGTIEELKELYGEEE